MNSRSGEYEGVDADGRLPLFWCPHLCQRYLLRGAVHLQQYSHRFLVGHRHYDNRRLRRQGNVQ